jgi:hypothetical protein
MPLCLVEFAIYCSLGFMFIGGPGLLYAFYKRRSNSNIRLGAVLGFGAQTMILGTFFALIYGSLLVNLTQLIILV